MKSAVIERETTFDTKAPVWLLLAALLIAICTLSRNLPSWQFMWVLAISVLVVVKGLTVSNCESAQQASPVRFWAYLALWPGMDATAFFSDRQIIRPRFGEWLIAFAKTLLGAFLVFAVAPSFIHQHELLAGWVGMIGIALVLHFGLFHLLSLAWRACGIDAQPIMNAPILASSLGDFWGCRWNLAFRDFAHAVVFRPLLRKIGVAKSMIAVFLVSGVLHDAVISIPAKGGWGLPTLYFLMQGCGLLVERSRFGKRLGPNSGITSRLFCASVVLGPVGLLFHPPFVKRIVVPMLTALTA